jgi:hypothetical protein
MQERVRYGWYRRWLAQPQRMQPGTRMPTIFAEGRTLLDDVLGGKAEAQEEAMWVYLGLGMNLPLPEGLEPPKGMALTVKDRPFLLRTFMPEAGSKAIAVGFPGQVAVAFDAAQCRLAYAWAGNFLDADFDAQAKDPGYGAGVPEGQVYQGPVRLHFTGYTLDKDGSPAFRYRVTGPDGTTATVTERARPLRKPAAVGLLRKFEVVPPVGQTVWLLAGETGATPEAIDAQGQTVPLALKDGRLDVPAEARLLVLPQGNQAHVLELKEAPAAGWTLARQGNRWLALVRISPPPGSGAVVPVALQVWSPYRAEPAVIRELLKDN